MIRGNTRERRTEFNAAVGAGAANAFNVCDTRWSETLDLTIAIVTHDWLPRVSAWASHELKRRTPLPQKSGVAAKPIKEVPKSLVQLTDAFRRGVPFVSAQARIIVNFLQPLSLAIVRSQGAHQQAAFGLDDADSVDSVRASIKPLATVQRVFDFESLCSQRDPAMLAGLTSASNSAELTLLREYTVLAAQSFEKKWLHNDLSTTLQLARRQALFVPSSAVELASRSPSHRLFSAVNAPSPTAADLGIPLNAAVLQQWHAYCNDVRELARLRVADSSSQIMPAHVFWRARLEKHAELARAALRDVAKPFSIASLERDFSTMHRIQVDNRLAMSDEYLVAEMFVAGNKTLPK